MQTDFVREAEPVRAQAQRRAPAQTQRDRAKHGGTIDRGRFPKISPDAVAVGIQGGITDERFRESVPAHLRNRDVASELPAVRDAHTFFGDGVPFGRRRAGPPSGSRNNE